VGGHKIDLNSRQLRRKSSERQRRSVMVSHEYGVGPASPEATHEAGKRTNIEPSPPIHNLDLGACRYEVTGQWSRPAEAYQPRFHDLSIE
jgi:hypothetical protein